jgi:hypothetical protein
MVVTKDRRNSFYSLSNMHPSVFLTWTTDLNPA